MASWKLRIKKLLNQFRGTPPLELSVAQLALVLEVAHELDHELLELISKEVARQERQFLVAAAEQADLPGSVDLLPHGFLEGSAASNLDILLRRTFSGSAAPARSQVSLSSALAEHLARGVAHQAPERVARLPLGLLEKLELSDDEIAGLLEESQDPQARQRLIRLAGRSSQSRDHR